MREETKTYKVYQFDELDDKARQKVLKKFAYFNVEDDFWYECLLSEAKENGLEIPEFDTYHRTVKAVLHDPIKFANWSIKEWGTDSELHRMGKKFLEDRSKLSDDDEDGEIDLRAEYERELGEEYLSMLVKEYDYATSEESIIESIKANEYEFLENGELYR